MWCFKNNLKPRVIKLYIFDKFLKENILITFTHSQYLADYAIEMGSDMEGRPGQEVQLTCTTSAPESLEHPPTVTWFRQNTHSDDHLEVGIQKYNNCYISG